MAPHFSTLAWKIPWMEEPGRLQSMGSLRVGRDWVTSLSLFTFMHWKRKWQPTPVFLPGESQERGSLVAAVYRVAQSRTRLNRLSSSSSIKAYSFLFIYMMLIQQNMLTQGFQENFFIWKEFVYCVSLMTTVLDDLPKSDPKVTISILMYIA